MLGNLEKTNDYLHRFITKIKHILSWTKIKTELNEQYYNQSIQDISKPHAIRGDIYFAYLGTNVGAEIDKGRPVLIFQNDNRYIRQSNLVLVFPITSNIKENPYKVIIKPEDIIDNLNIKNGAILIQQIRSISKNRLFRYIGKLSNGKIQEVSEKLNMYLYKNTPLLYGEGDAQTIPMDAAKSVDEV
ncbi:MAG TPA: type II toxin-antitoxin system PemK/MazF family toxin [Candidatus Paceibacterota bacterium]